MKNFNPKGEAISFVFIEEYMFNLAESTGIILDPMCRIAFQNGGSVVRTGSERSILVKLQFSTGSLAVVVNVLSLIHLAQSWKMPLYLGGDWNGHIGNDHGGDDIHIGPFTSSTPAIPKEFVFARTFANEDLYLEDSFHSLVRRGTWRHNNGNWYENDELSDHVVKRYSLNIGAGQGKIGARSIRERIFKINTRKIMETKKDN